MSTAAVELLHLTRRFGDALAVDDLSLTVEGPGVFGFLGANGAGKTTTLRMMAGLLRPTSGTIRLLGQDLDRTGAALRHHIGYLPQSPAFPAWMTGEEYLHHTGDLFGLSRKESRRRAAELLDRCGLDDGARRRRIGGYSGGMKQRLGIAQALMNRPRLILLDEPVSALDPVGRAEVLELVRELGTESTVFMSSHILGDVERVSEDVAILHRGRLLVHEQTRLLRSRAMTPTLRLVVRGDGKKLETRLRESPVVRDVSRVDADVVDGGVATELRITGEELLELERLIPRLVAETDDALVSLQAAMPSLEEVFMRLVGSVDTPTGAPVSPDHVADTRTKDVSSAGSPARAGGDRGGAA